MTMIGYYQRMTENGQVKTSGNVTFENTGIKDRYGKVIWRKLNKDGTPSNVFAEQFVPNMPWVIGHWFCRINPANVLRNYPHLKVETERSKSMTDEEYLDFLESRYFG